MTYRDDRYRLAVRALPCTLNVAGVPCPTGPSIIVHNDMQALGKGTGIKSADTGAAGCPGCHDALARLSRDEQHYYTMRGTIRTVTELMRRGWLGWTVGKRDIEREIRARVA